MFMLSNMLICCLVLSVSCSFCHCPSAVLCCLMCVSCLLFVFTVSFKIVFLVCKKDRIICPRHFGWAAQQALLAHKIHAMKPNENHNENHPYENPFWQWTYNDIWKKNKWTWTNHKIICILTSLNWRLQDFHNNDRKKMVMRPWKHHFPNKETIEILHTADAPGWEEDRHEYNITHCWGYQWQMKQNIMLNSQHDICLSDLSSIYIYIGFFYLFIVFHPPSEHLFCLNRAPKSDLCCCCWPVLFQYWWPKSTTQLAVDPAPISRLMSPHLLHGIQYPPWSHIRHILLILSVWRLHITHLWLIIVCLGELLWKKKLFFQHDFSVVLPIFLCNMAINQIQVISIYPRTYYTMVNFDRQ